MAGHPGQAEYWNPGTWQLHLGKCLPSHKFKWHSSDKWQSQQVTIMWQAKYAEISHERFDWKKVAPSQFWLGPWLDRAEDTNDHLRNEQAVHSEPK